MNCPLQGSMQVLEGILLLTQEKVEHYLCLGASWLLLLWWGCSLELSSVVLCRSMVLAFTCVTAWTRLCRHRVSHSWICGSLLVSFALSVCGQIASGLSEVSRLALTEFGLQDREL